MRIGQIITEYLAAHDMSAREFAEKCGMSNGYISTLIKGQRKDRTGEIDPTFGVVVKIANAMGVSVEDLTLRLRDSDTEIKMPAVRIPVLGTVRAGIPMDAVENILDYEEISPDMSGEYFALRIKGDSMSPRICDGDVVIVKEQRTVESGEIAIVLVNGNEATCKRVLLGKDGITLVGLNPTFEPIHYDKNEVISLPLQIIGKVVECRSKF